MSGTVQIKLVHSTDYLNNLPDPEQLALLASADVQLLGLTTVRVTSAPLPGGAPAVQMDITGAFTFGLGGIGGTVTGVTLSYDDPATAAVDFTLALTMTSLSVPLPALFDALRDGDSAGLENLFFGGADTITGSTGADLISAGGGADTVRSGEGADTVSGGLSNDRIYGGDGNDQLHGDSPVSTAFGNDALYGEAGNDLILGGGGRDLLFGGIGDDILVGGDGNDLLQGDAGADRLLGGRGADNFRLARLSDSSTVATLRDTVVDFRAAEFDTLDLSLLDADSTLAGNQAFAFIGTAAFGTNTPGQLRYEVVGGGILVQGSTDNDAAAEFAVFLRGVSGIAEASIIL